MLLDKVNVNLRVIPMRGWKRGLWYDQTGLPWTPPSPNMPDILSAALYPGIGCFESTNMSVGRGTPHPFLWIGAPWLDAKAVLRILRHAHLKGIWFSAQEYTPAKSLYEGQKCPGIGMRITDRDQLRPLRLFAHLVCALRATHPKEFEVRWDEIRRMTGTDRFRELYESGAAPDKIIQFFDKEADAFKRTRKLYLMY